jgi:hypothetical protein
MNMRKTLARSSVVGSRPQGTHVHVGERDLSPFDGSPQIRREDRVEVVVAAPFPEFPREKAASRRRPSPKGRSERCQDGWMTVERPVNPGLQPEDERSALVQRLDQYRAIAANALADVSWPQASARLLPATDLTIAGIVRHLAWAEDRWFQGRLLGSKMPSPWDQAGADDADHSMRLTPGDTVEGLLELYSSACERSRDAVARSDSLSQLAAVPSFGVGPVNLRWILVHMIDETARHAGHLDLLRDTLTRV